MDMTADALVSEYTRIETLAATHGREPGRVQVMGWDLEYPSPDAVLSFLDYICFRRINDFLPDSDRPVILDCGANIGYTVLHYKRQCPAARIIAFEPDPQFAPMLRRNLQRNGLADVRVIEAAAWTADGRSRWVMEGVDGSRLATGGAAGAAALADVATVDLLRYLDGEIDLLKIDVEGAEFALVPHLAPRLRHVKNIVVECHIGDQDQWEEFARLLTTLRQAEFRVSMNSYGPWRDLTRRHEVAPLHAAQYIVVSGWRDESARVSREQTFLPYIGLAHYRDLRHRHDDRAQQAASERQRAELGRTVIDLMTGRTAWAMHSLRGPFASERGCCWTCRLPDALAPGDSSAGLKSAILVVEDDRVLGPAHSPHADIREHGAGRYSHWNQQLYFSSSDGSDPNTNGRTYLALHPR
jgi:FkbM family methyltransferase